jgi:hypothetical protein
MPVHQGEDADMGMRGPGAQRNHELYCSPEFRELIYGPADKSPNHVRLLRNHWRDRGAKAAHKHYWEPGRRAWAWWEFTCPLKERRKARTFRTEAEAILALGFADDEEREAIRSEGVIEKQIREKARAVDAA